jgi:hypothetical protein
MLKRSLYLMGVDGLSLILPVHAFSIESGSLSTGP